MTLKDVQYQANLVLPHDPDASEIYRWDWLEWLDGETISTQTIIVDAGITATLHSLGTTYVDIRISGGTIGITYGVTNRVTSSGGRIQDRTVFFNVKKR